MRDRKLGFASWCAVLVLAGCSKDAPPVATTAAGRPATAGVNEFTAAVPVGAANATAKVDFKLQGKPQVGMPLVVSLRLMPSVAVDAMQIAVAPDEGLGLDSTVSASIELGPSAAAQQQIHDVRVVPTKEGVFLLKVSVSTTPAGGTARSTEFAVPVLVGGTG